MATVFEDVPSWPSAKTEAARDPRYDNQPPLEDRVMLEFVEDLEREGVTARIQELIESAGRVPAITDQTIAGKVGDLCKLARDVEKRVNDAREKHNRPLLNAQRSLKGRADGLLHPLLVAISGVRTNLNTFMAEQARIAEELRRKAEEEARRIREDQERRAREAEEAGKPTLDPIVDVAPVRVAEPVARGDLGSRVGTRTVWKHEIEVPIAKLPKAILENEKVRAAVDQVVASMVRTGSREIKGVRVWSEQVADVR
jgi:hypothetical protein